VSIIRVLALVFLLAVHGSTALAASYIQTDGTIVDPIQRRTGGAHPYSGPNLEPFANLSGVDLVNAELIEANLTGADLSSAHLGGSDLNFADLQGANLAATTYLGATSGTPFYNASTDFTNAYSGDFGVSPLFDPVAAAWIFVPEPNSALLLVLGFAGIAAQRRGA